MRNRIFIAAIMSVACMAPVARASAQAMMSAMPAQVVTTGTAEVRVNPDRATLFLGVQSRAATAAAAGADNARRQKAVLDTLRSLGLTGEQLQTVNYNVSPEMQYNQTTGTSRVTGYVVSNQVRAEIRRIEDVGKIIDAALLKGANEVSSLQFTSSKADSVRRVALAAAVADARADAEALARAAGGTLGALLEVSAGSMPIRPMVMDQRMAMARAVGSVASPIEPGQQTYSATVTARWLFVNR
jgi:uncharacterized protein